MDWNFTHRVVAVTGSASGVGEKAVARFAAAKAQVYALDIDPQRGAEAATTAGATFVQCDVTKDRQVAAAFERIHKEAGRLDVLVNNAGGFWHQRTTETLEESEWDQIVDLNLKSVYLCARHSIALLRKSDAGRIVNVASLTGQTGGYTSSPPYAAAKAGVLALTRVMAGELAAHNITVNALSPSAVMTDRISHVRSAAEITATAQSIPLGRYATPDEIVSWVMFLASNESSYMTGQVVSVNGGRFMA